MRRRKRPQGEWYEVRSVYVKSGYAEPAHYFPSPIGDTRIETREEAENLALELCQQGVGSGKVLGIFKVIHEEKRVSSVALEADDQ